jgi:Stress responsive A/B Barrel Domain
LSSNELICLLTSQADITHGFVVEFESVEDRDYYTSKDPTHLAFTKVAGEVLVKAIVVDFNPGSFGTAKS